MKRSMLISVCGLVLLVALLLVVQAALAMSDGYDLSWNTLFAGGATSGGAYTMDSAIGQPVAVKVSAGAYELCAGYLCDVKTESRLYLPVVRK
jgi:hypothetical protein